MELTYNVSKPVDTVFDYLSDMQKFASIHPVIDRIDRVSGNDYLVHETLKLWFIPFSFTYKASVDADTANKKVVIVATVMGLTKIEMSYALYPENTSTVVRETILIQSPLPIKTMVAKTFEKEHATLFRNMEAAK